MNDQPETSGRGGRETLPAYSQDHVMHRVVGTNRMWAAMICKGCPRTGFWRVAVEDYDTGDQFWEFRLDPLVQPCRRSAVVS
jgi:hypothetical protein